MKKIGFIGLGNMGKPMALNLVKAGYHLVVCDKNPAPVAELVAQGAGKAASPRQVAEQSEVIITILPSSPHVEEVICGKNGILEGASQGTTIIEMSTINPLVTRRVAKLAEGKGVHLIDAPVSGGVPRAQDGTLTVMVGGNKDIMEDHRPILQALSNNIVHVGGIGMGGVVKLANQLLVGIQHVAMAESFLFGIKLGADPKVLFDVITRSSGDSFILRQRVPYPGLSPTSPANNNFTPGFTTDLMAKDMDLILSAAKEINVPLPTSSLAYQLFEAAKASGYGQKDCSIVSLILRRLAGDDI